MHNPDFKPESYPFFKFTPASYSNGEITLADPYAQGIFMNICCLYWPRAGKLTIHFCRRQMPFIRDPDIESLVKLKAIKIDKDGFVHINFLDEQMSDCVKNSRKQSKNGSDGGRPPKTQDKAKNNPEKTQNKPSGSANVNPEKSKENEIRQDKSGINTTVGSSVNQGISQNGSDATNPRALWARLVAKANLTADEELERKGIKAFERILKSPARKVVFQVIHDHAESYATNENVIEWLEGTTDLHEKPKEP